MKEPCYDYNIPYDTVLTYFSCWKARPGPAIDSWHLEQFSAHHLRIFEMHLCRYAKGRLLHRHNRLCKLHFVSAVPKALGFGWTRGVGTFKCKWQKTKRQYLIIIWYKYIYRNYFTISLYPSMIRFFHLWWSEISWAFRHGSGITLSSLWVVWFGLLLGMKWFRWYLKPAPQDSAEWKVPSWWLLCNGSPEISHRYAWLLCSLGIFWYI